MHFGSCVLDVESRRLYRDGLEVSLPPRAVGLLKLLIEQAPKAVAKTELLDLLGPDTIVSEHALAKLVSDVRALIGDRAERPRVIRTLHGFGYALSAGAEHQPSLSARLTWANRDFPLREGENVIGRSRDVAVPIHASIVSRRHARIVVDQGSAHLEDLGSKNGTFVGSDRIILPRLLADGDIIKVGDHYLIYRTTTASAVTVTR
jgi:DNA-binding winged helix-turn-helix (wHTH) protein